MAEKDKTFYDGLREKFMDSTGLQNCPSLFELWMKGYQAALDDCAKSQTKILDSMTVNR